MLAEVARQIEDTAFTIGGGEHERAGGFACERTCGDAGSLRRESGEKGTPGPATIAFMRDTWFDGDRLMRAEHGPLRIAGLTEQAGDLVRVERRVCEAVADDEKPQRFAGAGDRAVKYAAWSARVRVPCPSCL